MQNISFSKSKKIGGSVILVLILFSLYFMNGICFSETPTYTDPSGDQGGGPNFMDMTNIWIDDNTTFIKFKVQLNGPFNQTLSYYWIDALITVNNNTGTYDAKLQMRLNYYIYVSVSADHHFYMGLHDFINSSNTLANTQNYGLSYYSLTNGNRTLEFGYKLRTNNGHNGYLNATAGQWVLVKFSTGFDPDEAPDDYELPLSYQLSSNPGGTNIPGFNLPLLGLSLIAVAMLYLMVKKKETF